LTHNILLYIIISVTQTNQTEAAIDQTNHQHNGSSPDDSLHQIRVQGLLRLLSFITVKGK